MKWYLLLVCMILFLSGCSVPRPETGVQMSDGTPFDDGCEIKCLIRSDAEVPYDESWDAWKCLREESGATLVVSAVSEDRYQEVVSLKMSSAETMPDLLDIQNREMLEACAEKLVSLDDYLGMMPNYRHAKETRDGIARFGEDGKLYLPEVFVSADFFGQKRWMYRADVLKTHGLEVPSTLDELYAVCVELKKLDPTTYPLLIKGNMEAINLLAPAFRENLNYRIYYDTVDEAWKFGAIQEEMRNLCQWVRKMVDEGLMPPDGICLSDEVYEAALKNGCVFTICEAERQSDLQMTGMVPPCADGGVHKIGESVLEVPGFAVCNSKDEMRITNAICFLDFLYSDRTAQFLSWGKEETPFICDGFDTMRRRYGVATSGLTQCLDDAVFAGYLPNDSISLHTASSEISFEMLQMNEKEKQIVSQYDPTLRAYAEEVLLGFANGTIPISEWDRFVAEVSEMELDLVLFACETAWERMER